jgi:hypothetical protein
MKVRFWRDGMLSFSELSPWVGQLKLPITDECPRDIPHD